MQDWEKPELERGETRAGNGIKFLERIQIGNNKVTLSKEYKSTYRLGVGKMLHMMRWSRPDILNSVPGCSMMMIFTM